MDAQRFHGDPTYWWLRLHYALRDGRLDDAAEAQRQLASLGFEVLLRDVQPSAERGV